MITQLFLRGKPIGNVKGVLFDKDGTLSNSEPHLKKLAKSRINEAINLFKKKKASLEELSKLKSLLSTAYGLKDKELHPDGLLAIASRKDNLIATATIFCLLREPWSRALTQAEEVFSSADKIGGELNQENLDIRDLLPGAHHLLITLQKANIKCAVISNDTPSGIQSFLNRTSLKDILKNYWSSENFPAKPNPEAVKGLCKQIGIPPYECALIGDADTDLKMARQAGIGLSLGYIAGWSTPPRLTAHQYLIHHWDELSLKANPKVNIKLGSS